MIAGMKHSDSLVLKHHVSRLTIVVRCFSILDAPLYGICRIVCVFALVWLFYQPKIKRRFLLIRIKMLVNAKY